MTHVGPGLVRAARRLSHSVVQTEMHDPFATHAAANRLRTGLRRVLRTFSRSADRPVHLQRRVKRVTGIEPAWPAWKGGFPSVCFGWSKRSRPLGLLQLRLTAVRADHAATAA